MYFFNFYLKYLGLKGGVSTGLQSDNNVQPGSGFRTVNGRGRGVRGKKNKKYLVFFKYY